MKRGSVGTGVAVAAALASCCYAGSARAQDPIVRNVTAPAGQITRLAIVPNLDQACKAGEGGTIRIVSAPRNGFLLLKGAQTRTLSTHRCPGIDAQVQVLYYRPNDRFTGADEVVMETRLPDGTPRLARLRINVSSRPSRPERGPIDL